MINIIIVDDNPIFRKGINVFLQSVEGFKVIAEASDGSDLLKLLETLTPDLVIIDIEMDGMNGIDLAKKVNYLYQDLPLIGLTLYWEYTLFDIISAGYKACLYKPDATIKIIDVINEVLNGKYSFPKKLFTKKKQF